MSVGFEQGLRDVIAAESTICQVDGAEGRLRYRGYEVGDLAAGATFEEVVGLLLSGELPDEGTLSGLRSADGAASELRSHDRDGQRHQNSGPMIVTVRGIRAAVP